jgi:hypothetical protein
LNAQRLREDLVAEAVRESDLPTLVWSPATLAGLVGAPIAEVEIDEELSNAAISHLDPPRGEEPTEQVPRELIRAMIAQRAAGVGAQTEAPWPRMFEAASQTAELAWEDDGAENADTAVHPWYEPVESEGTDLHTLVEPVSAFMAPEDELTAAIDRSWTAEYTSTPANEGSTRTDLHRPMTPWVGPVIPTRDEDPDVAEAEEIDPETLRKLRERYERGGEPETYVGPMESIGAPETPGVAGAWKRFVGWFSGKR